jgi:signal transduction histidine kinase
MRSIQSRLGVGLALSLIVIFVLQWVVGAVSLRRLSESNVLAHMEHDVDSILAGLSFGVDGSIALAPERIEQVYRQPFSGYYYRVASGPHTLRSRSLWDKDLPAITLSTGYVDTRYATGPLAQPLLLHTRAFELRGRPVTISIARDLSPIENDLLRFRNRYAVVSGAALLALLLLQTLTVRLSLASLARTRADLTRLERGDIERLDERVPTEFRPLVGELNRLLGIMRQRLTRSRQALGNLAHAMKTPLTLLADLERDHRLDALPEIQRPLAAQTQVLRRLVDRELTRARLAGAAAPGRRFDPAPELADLIDALKAIYRAKTLTFDTRIAANLCLTADREDMIELLGNLLDNAAKWATANVAVTVEVSDGNAAVITVEDDGPGCAPEALAQLAQRGVRLDESTAGHGLGLSIAHDIVALYQGSIEFGRSAALGGFRARVALPLVAAPN